MLLVFFNSLYADDRLLVAIDIGHTLSHQGATSSRGVGEYIFNRAVANILIKKIINNISLDGFIINSGGDAISLKKRTEIAASKKADILISLHHDSVNERYLKKWEYNKKTYNYCDLYSGYSIFISKKNINFQESYEFGKILGRNFINSNMKPTLHHSEKIDGENRKLLNSKFGVYEFDNLLVLKTARMPAILLECGIIVNRKNEQLLNTISFRNKISDIIIKSLLQYEELSRLQN